MKKLILCLFILLQTSISYSEEVKETTSVPKEVYYKFIKKVRPDISIREMKDIFRAIKYYTPRYFGVKGITEESLSWILPAIAQESSFRNQNGDRGNSIGYMMVTRKTCGKARRHNGIKKRLNLTARWDNVHCGMAEMNRLYTNPLIKGNWELVIRGYNSGLHVLKEPVKHARGMRMNEKHLQRVKYFRKMLLSIIEDYRSTVSIT
ncbi:transglycosylase SLT domain-containing protein [Candidatus Pacearchaeota archaeon]|nr:transglycosylase SLT domain-containing protein [Candidatus Pacearchaeota archaeon]